METNNIQYYLKLVAFLLIASLLFAVPQQEKGLAKPHQVSVKVVASPKPKPSISPTTVPVETPKPEPTPIPAPVASSGSVNIEDIVRQAARAHGVDEGYLVRIAKCESGLNPNAVNYGYNENGYPSGLFQHLSGYWPARAAKYGYAGASVFDPVANANVTAQMFRDGLSRLWECK